MLNHAAWVNRERAERHYEATKGKESGAEKDPMVMGGKRLSELNTAETVAYYRDFSGG
jgi:hypothetical protein